LLYFDTNLVPQISLGTWKKGFDLILFVTILFYLLDMKKLISLLSSNVQINQRRGKNAHIVHFFLILTCHYLLTRFFIEKNVFFPSGADAIKKFTPSLGIPYLGV